MRSLQATKYYFGTEELEQRGKGTETGVHSESKMTPCVFVLSTASFYCLDSSILFDFRKCFTVPCGWLSWMSFNGWKWYSEGWTSSLMIAARWRRRRGSKTRVNLTGILDRTGFFYFPFFFRSRTRIRPATLQKLNTISIWIIVILTKKENVSSQNNQILTNCDFFLPVWQCSSYNGTTHNRDRTPVWQYDPDVAI